MSSRRIPAGLLALAALLWLVLLTVPPPATAQQAHDPQPAAGQQPREPEHGTPSEAGVHAEAGQAEGAGAGHGDEGHGESIWSFLSRIANFLILAGGLYYLLRSPVGRYLDARAQQIQSDLVTAADTRRDATKRMSEIEALKARGKDESAAEQERIRLAAEAERQRLVEQTRREIDRQLQIARRDLTAHAADLALGVARARLDRELTGEQQIRLIDRYVTQVETRHE